MFGDIIRGGQTFMHRVQMFAQVIKKALLVSVLGWIVIVSVHMYKEIPVVWWWDVAAYNQAEMQLYIMPILGSKKNTITQQYYGREVWSQSVIDNREIATNNQAFWIITRMGAMRGCWSGILFLFVVIASLKLRGRSQNKIRHVRGARLVEGAKLKRMLKWRFKASDITIAGVPIVKGSEKQGILLWGASGSGKTTVAEEIVKRARACNDKIVFIDTSNNYYKKFGREGEDHILNPLDKRGKIWTPWNECLEEPHYEQFVSSAIKDTGQSNDPFWTEASRVVVAELLRELKRKGNTTNKELARHLFYDRVSELKEILHKTCAARFTEEEAEKMSYGVLANFIAPLQFLRYLPDGDDQFSIRNWMKEEKNDSCLFLTAKKDHLKMMTPMLSMWFDCARNALLSLGENNNRRVWFIIDELPSLKKLDGLEEFILEARKVGGCLVAGVQSVASLEKYYGREGATELLDNFGTKAIFRTGDKRTAQDISDLLGSEEILETQEQVSVGVHEVRGSTTYSSSRKERTLVMPSEILNMAQFQGFLKVPGNYPTAKITTIRKELPKISESFIPSGVVATFVENDKFAEKLGAKYEKEFNMDEIVEDRETLLIEDATSDVVDVEVGEIAKDEEGVVVAKPKGEVLLESFECKGEGLLLRFKAGEEVNYDENEVKKIVEIESSLGECEISIKHHGQYLMIGDAAVSAKELFYRRMALGSKIVSLREDGTLLLVLNRHRLVSLSFDALDGFDRAVGLPKISGCKEFLRWGDREMGILEIFEKGELV